MKYQKMALKQLAYSRFLDIKIDYIQTLCGSQTAIGKERDSSIQKLFSVSWNLMDNFFANHYQLP